MAEYIYDREFGDAIHSNPDTYNIGHQGEPENVAQRISDALPGVDFVVCNNGTECKVITTEALTSEQQTTLANAIAAQKAVDDWPPAEPSSIQDVQLKNFQDLSGYNVFRKGFNLTATAGQTNEFEAKYAANMMLQGAAYKLDGNVNDGDYVEIEMVDVDNILGYGAGFVLGKFAETNYVWADQEFSCCCPDAKLVPAGIYIRFRYESTGSTDVNIKLVHFMRTVP